jgi:hypothetical protein
MGLVSPVGRCFHSKFFKVVTDNFATGPHGGACHVFKAMPLVMKRTDPSPIAVFSSRS